MRFVGLRDFFLKKIKVCFGMRSKVLSVTILDPIWPPIWMKIPPQVEKKYVVKTLLKPTLKNIPFKVEN